MLTLRPIRACVNNFHKDFNALWAGCVYVYDFYMCNEYVYATWLNFTTHKVYMGHVNLMGFKVQSISLCKLHRSRSVMSSKQISCI